MARRAEHRREKRQRRIEIERQPENSAVCAALFPGRQIRNAQHTRHRHEYILRNNGVAAGAAHPRREPRVAHRVFAGREQEQHPFRRTFNLGKSADDRPMTVRHAAREGRTVSRNAIATRHARDLRARLDRRCNDDIGRVRPDGLLRLGGEHADDVRVMAHETGAPAVRRVGFADLVGDIEPGFEIEPITAKARRHQHARDPSVDQFPDGIVRQMPRFFSRRRTLAKFRSKRPNPVQYVLFGRGPNWHGCCGHQDVSPFCTKHIRSPGRRLFALPLAFPFPT